jgi:hypothetical protein
MRSNAHAARRVVAVAVEKTEIQLSVSGEATTASAMDNVTRKLDGVTKATKQVAEASQATARATASVTAATEAASSATVRATAGFARFGPTLGIVAQGMSTMGGATGQVTQVLGAASGAVAGLTTAFGPLGLALGAIGAAFTVYQRIVAAAREETEQLAKTQRDALEFSRQYADAMSTEGRIRRAQQQNQLNADRNRLLGSEEGLLVRIQDLTEQIASARASDDRAWFAGALERRRDQLRAELAELRAERDAQTRPARGGGGGGGSAVDLRGVLGAAERLSAEPGMNEGFGAPSGESMINSQTEAFAAASERLNEINAAGNKELEYRNQLMAEQAELTRQSIEEVGAYASILTGPVVDGLAAAVRGEMSLAQAMKRVVSQRLQAIAIEEAVLAIVATAKALGASVLNPASAAAFWAEAATHAKAAAAAGVGAAVSGAIGMAGGGGGGGGGGVSAAAASPTRDTSQSASGGGDKNITIYFGSPVVTATTVAELGREIKSAILVADARYGV